MLHQLSWIKISVLFFLCCAVANLRSEEDHSDKEAISKFTSKSCHKTRTAQCNINLFTFSCLHVAFHFLWTKRHEIVGRHMEEEWCVWACSRAHTIGSWNVDTTVKTWLCQDYDINFDCFFSLSLSLASTFSLLSDVDVCIVENMCIFDVFSCGCIIKIPHPILLSARIYVRCLTII